LLRGTKSVPVIWIISIPLAETRQSDGIRFSEPNPAIIEI
jgi:hypothetical protein